MSKPHFTPPKSAAGRTLPSSQQVGAAVPETPEAVLGQGNVLVHLPTRTQPLVLRPTLYAAMTLSKLYGGLDAVIDKIVSFDLEVVYKVLELGATGKQTPTLQAREAFYEELFQAGMTDDTGSLGKSAIEYVAVLMRGGRPAPVESENQEKIGEESNQVDPLQP